MTKLTVAAALCLGLMSGSAFAASGWTGGDDLPTNPLACDGTAAAPAAKPYDGGEPANACARRRRFWCTSSARFASCEK